VDAVIDTNLWKVPALFELLQSQGGIAREEMFQVFNMGIGMTLVVPAARAAEAIARTRGRRIGSIAAGTGVVRLL
jgi:phosphoribosylformylglycinamidine cyclo-ligase